MHSLSVQTLALVFKIKYTLWKIIEMKSESTHNTALARSLSKLETCSQAKYQSLQKSEYWDLINLAPAKLRK